MLETAERGAGPTVLDRLVDVGLAYVRFALARPHEFRLMFSRETVPGSRDPAVRAANDRASAPVVRLVEELCGGGSAADPSPEAVELAVQLWAMVHGTAVLMLERQLEEGLLSTPARGVDREPAALSILARGMARLLGHGGA